MFKKTILGAMAIVLTFGTVSTTFASLRTLAVNDTIQIRWSGYGYRQNSGGEFQLQRGGALDPGKIVNYQHTFCAELTEFLTSGDITVVGLTKTTVQTGKNMTEGAAKLFRDYMVGTAPSSYGFDFPGTNFTLGGGVEFNLDDAGNIRAGDGASVQNALWSLIGWTAADGVSLSGDAQDLVDHYQTFNGSGNFYGVRFANLMKGNNDVQDQFALIVPEPGSVMIWSVLGMAVCGAGRRRRR